MKKNLIAFLLASTLTLSMAGCGGTDANANAADQTKGNAGSSASADADTTQATTAEPPPAERIQAAAEKARAATSVKSMTILEMKDGSEGMDMTMDMSFLNESMKMKADVDVSLGSMGEMGMELYGQVDGNQYKMYTNFQDQWTTEILDLEDAAQYDTLGELDLYLSGCVEMQADGSEALSAGTADKFTGVIKGSSLKEVLESSGVADSMGGTLSEDDLEKLVDMVKDMADMPVSIWIDQVTDYPVKLSLDMTDAMNSMMKAAIAAETADDADDNDVDDTDDADDNDQDERLAAAEDVSFDVMKLDMTFSDFNNVPDFEIPSKALTSSVTDD